MHPVRKSQALLGRSRGTGEALVGHMSNEQMKHRDVSSELLKIDLELAAFGGMRRRVSFGRLLKELEAARDYASDRLGPWTKYRLERHQRSLALLSDEISHFQAGLQEWADTTILTNQRRVEESRRAVQFRGLVRRVERLQSRNRALLALLQRTGA